MSARDRIEHTIETVFETLFPWDETPEAVGNRIYWAHALFLAWVGIYHGIYILTGRISRLGWLLLLAIYTTLTVQFLMLGRCVFSAIEKRRLGTYVDLHGPILRRFGYGRYTRHALFGHYGLLALSMMLPKGGHDLFIGLFRGCFS